MIKVAVTGNIASGKSEVQNILVEKGYKVLDTDIVAHKLLNEYSSEIRSIFKDFDISDTDGKISREKLGRIVFTVQKAKDKLEKYIHPKIKVQISKFFDSNMSEKIVFVSIPLLFEANMQSLFDKIILVYANDNIRLKRLIDRNGYSDEYALKRLNSQDSQDKKSALCDYVILNNSDIDRLKTSVLETLTKITQDGLN